ncbi:MAG: polyphosphate polymerase domain-containing protein [Flavobacteriales bacterium]|nr:polyphosphate polymerase domain-containing protein [Flavobacteriales bacterium]
MQNQVEIANTFSSIDLQQLTKVDFDGRIDTKFIFHQDQLPAFLHSIKQDAVILEVAGKRLFPYRNIYFDTAEFKYFGYHQAGRATRLKLRARAYNINGPFVFEVKRKTNKGLTVKKRLSLPNFDRAVSPETEAFLQSELGFGFNELPKQVVVNYSRMTFANRAMTEKFTLDIGLETKLNGEPLPFHNLVIAEVKQEKFSNRSVFVKNLKALRIYPHSFSKYCGAVMKINQEIKKNRFKPILRKLEKIEHGII